MNKGRMTLGLLVVSLAAPGLYAQTGPAKPVAAAQGAPAAQAAVNPVDPASIEALKAMGAYLRTLKRFNVSTELTGERVLEDGQKLQHSALAEIDAASPNNLRARMSSARAEREIFYNGKKATLYLPDQKYYSTVDYSGTLGELVVEMEARYGVQIPMADLFLWGTPNAPLDSIQSAMFAGQDFIGTDLCNHYAFRQNETDWQIWITAGGKPLPRKIVITNRADEARPQSVSYYDWNLKPAFKDAIFRFTPPKGATAVELRSLEKK